VVAMGAAKAAAKAAVTEEEMVEVTAAARGEETAAVAREVVAMAAAKAAAKAAETEERIGRRSLRRMREQVQRGQIGDTPMYSRM